MEMVGAKPQRSQFDLNKESRPCDAHAESCTESRPCDAHAEFDDAKAIFAFTQRLLRRRFML